MGLGDNIKVFRKEKKMSQSELANELGLSEIAVRKYESGQREPRLKTINCIANVLDVSVKDLLSDEHKHIGQTISNARNAIGISQRELGRRAGMSGQYIAKLEKCKVANPGLNAIKSIADALGISTNDLHCEHSIEIVDFNLYDFAMLSSEQLNRFIICASNELLRRLNS